MMTKKRLTRESKWGFQYFPYHQLWMNNDIYSGWVAINYLTDGEYCYWDFLKAGKVPVAGKGMCWLTLIPDGKSRSITAKFTKDRRVFEHTEIKKYVILDDCYSDDYSSDEEIKRHLVFVDALKGLQDEDCIQVCKLMNEIV